MIEVRKITKKKAREVKKDLLEQDDLNAFDIQIKLLKSMRKKGETKGERSPGRIDNWNTGTIMSDVLDIKAKHIMQQKKKSPTSSPKSWVKAKMEAS